MSCENEEQMTDKPILFSPEMVQALLAGRKTQTRRIVKPQPPLGFEAPEEGLAHRGAEGICGQQRRLMQDGDEGVYTITFPIKCSYYPGKLLWVREAFSIWDDGVVYRASNPECDGVTKWKPSIHMPRWASRLTLEITGVRVERLQDITEEDAEAEGAPPPLDGAYDNFGSQFAFLWESIKGKDSWQQNPWVWVIEFKVHKENIDKFLEVGDE